MPELPDLEVLKEVLAQKVTDREIVGARALRPGLLKTITPRLTRLSARLSPGSRAKGSTFSSPFAMICTSSST